MTQDRATPQSNGETPHQKVLASSYYALLGLHPSASVREIRQAYRELSKLYHPDTTALSTTIATTKFQQLNEAYATLSSPERRTIYDQKIGYSRVPVVRPLPHLSQSNTQTRASQSSSAYLDPTDRPLSPGEVFALFILGLTFVGCLVLAIAIGITRGEAVWQPTTVQNRVPYEDVTTAETSASKQPTTDQTDTTIAAPVSASADSSMPAPSNADSPKATASVLPSAEHLNATSPR